MDLRFYSYFWAKRQANLHGIVLGVGCLIWDPGLVQWSVDTGSRPTIDLDPMSSSPLKLISYTTAFKLACCLPRKQLQNHRSSISGPPPKSSKNLRCNSSHQDLLYLSMETLNRVLIFEPWPAPVSYHCQCRVAPRLSFFAQRLPSSCPQGHCGFLSLILPDAKRSK